jgi:hypothetical protein
MVKPRVIDGVKTAVLFSHNRPSPVHHLEIKGFGHLPEFCCKPGSAAWIRRETPEEFTERVLSKIAEVQGPQGVSEFDLSRSFLDEKEEFSNAIIHLLDTAKIYEPLHGWVKTID